MPGSISRQASTGGLPLVASEQQHQHHQQPTTTGKLQAAKGARSKRCKSLLMLSSPFTNSTSSVKLSLLSLLHPSQSSQNQDDHHQHQQESPSSSTDDDTSLGLASLAQTNNNKRRAKSVKMKLFEQPLDKLFSPKAIKQLNAASNSPDSLGRPKHRLVGCRRFSNADANNNNLGALAQGQRNRQLLLAVLPQPIRNLLSELYLRGPSTVGIFRKSPNAKHCKELRQKLETDSQSSIEQFQVTVIASVFKEWLRSLPDCLLMSRLYPQWIDVAKLIEPLYQSQQRRHQSQSLDDSYSDSTINGNTSLRPSRSPLTDSGGQLLDRARSCSTMLSEYSISNEPHDAYDSTERPGTPPSTMSAFALSERHSECLRIVRQLLDALNEPNLILLRSFISVLWSIAQNSEHNKMCANNLGVCVGQSLLNDEHQSSGRSSYSASTFTKRHRRTRSQCILSSTLSLTGSATLAQSGQCYLDSSGAQETAKYVPILVAFMIENAPALFGQDIKEIFAPDGDDNSAHGFQKETCATATLTATVSMESVVPKKESQVPLASDEVDSCVVASSGGNKLPAADERTTTPSTMTTTTSAASTQAKRQQIVVESRFRLIEKQQQQQQQPNCNMAVDQQHNHRVHHHDDSTTTSILIVNSNSQRQPRSAEPAQHRPLSATESTSSSRASSSTSGVHSESPAFSSGEVDSQHNSRTTGSSSSPSPSSAATSSVASSPVHEPQEAPSHLCATAVDSNGSRHPSRQLSDSPTRPLAPPPVVHFEPPRYQRRHMIDRYSTFMSVLNRVPKIPVQFATSTYGEAVIYNPKPSQQQEQQQRLIAQHQYLVAQQQYLLAQRQYFVAQRQYLVASQQFRQAPAPAVAGLQPRQTIGLTTHQAIQRPQPRLAKIRQNQFNGIYVKNPVTAEQSSRAPAAGSVGAVANKMKVSLSSDHSSDESDESMHDWVESTMV